MNQDFFLETDSKRMNQFINKALNIINMQTKNICRIIKNGIIGNGFLCNVSDRTFKRLFPILITSINILKYYDIYNDKKITLQFNNEEVKTLIINDGRKIYKINKEKFVIIFIEIKQSDGFDVNKFLEIDDLLYKKNESESDINIKEKKKDIYLIHYPNNEGNPLKTLTTMNNISIDKYKIRDLKSANEYSTGCPIFNCSNYKVIGIYNLYSNEINLNISNDLTLSINEYIKNMNNKNEIIISLKVTTTNNKSKKIYFLNNIKNKDKETGEILGKHYLNELSSINTQLYINFENQGEIKHNFQKYFLCDKGGNYKIRLVFDNKINDCSYMFSNCTLMK